jgi:FlaA1/EpsC-like NDP-sugar epimerase
LRTKFPAPAGRAFSRKAAAAAGDFFLFLAVLLGLVLLLGGNGAPFSGPVHPDRFLVLAGTAVPLLGLALWYAGVYRGLWRYVSIPDLVRLFAAVAGGWLLTLVVLEANGTAGMFSPALLVLTPILFFGAAASVRALVRVIHDRSLDFHGSGRVPVLVVGAGQGGEILLRELRRTGRYRPVGLVDDDRGKQGHEIHGVRVVGGVDDLPRLIAERGAEMVLVAMPSVRPELLDRIVTFCAQSRVPCRRMPLLAEITLDVPPAAVLRPIQVEDLLRRRPVRFDDRATAALLRGRRVLVTGGGGSIGSELVRQILRYDPALVLVFDHDEEALYRIGHELSDVVRAGTALQVLGSVLDPPALRRLFAEHAPEIVFHAAAYKHVPLSEVNVRSVVRNNLLGTFLVAEEAARRGTDLFVQISTDKTVHPRSVMGASKRAAELALLARPWGAMRTVVTRFGNVLDTSGSVVPLFRRQILEGGPLTVTDPEVTRYFMLIDEAVALILQAASHGRGGEIFVLDMGEPIRIHDLAERMIRLAGREPGTDIPIVYTGLRPGEKIHETLFYEDEELRPTPHPNILEAAPTPFSREETGRRLADLLDALDGEEGEILVRLRRLVPEYTPPSSPVPSPSLRVLDGGAGEPSRRCRESGSP